MGRLFWISLGGAIGTAARYLLSGWAVALWGAAFPYGTLVVNVIGSFLLGAVMHIGLVTRSLSPTLRVALATGVLGGFTTYSTFNYESLQYLRQGAFALAATNVAATIGLCLLAGWAGVALAQRVLGG